MNNSCARSHEIGLIRNRAPVPSSSISSISKAYSPPGFRERRHEPNSGIAPLGDASRATTRVSAAEAFREEVDVFPQIRPHPESIKVEIISAAQCRLGVIMDCIHEK